MILNRLSHQVENKLIKKPARFIPGKSYPGQVLNLTQFIENGFEANNRGSFYRLVCGLRHSKPQPNALEAI